MLTIPVLIRYVMYIISAVLINKLFPEFSREFLIACGILVEVLDAKYNNQGE